MTDISKAKVVHLEALPHDMPMPRLQRRSVIGTHMTLSDVSLEKGCCVPMHSHSNEQFSFIISGVLRFDVRERSDLPPVPYTVRAGEVIHLPLDVRERSDLPPVPYTVRAGEVIHLPPSLPHAVEALEYSRSFDMFSPPSETTGIDDSSAPSSQFPNG